MFSMIGKTIQRCDLRQCDKTMFGSSLTLGLCLILSGCDNPAVAKTEKQQPSGLETLSDADRSAIMLAAGYERHADSWKTCEGWDFGEITELRDFNGDGRSEVIVTSYGSACNGNTGQGFQLLTPAESGWTILVHTSGIPSFHARSGVSWPDIEIGGPGSNCFPVLRWSGREYVDGGYSYRGRADVCDAQGRLVADLPSEFATPLSATFQDIPEADHRPPTAAEVAAVAESAAIAALNASGHSGAQPMRTPLTQGNPETQIRDLVDRIYSAYRVQPGDMHRVRGAFMTPDLEALEMRAAEDSPVGLGGDAFCECQDYMESEVEYRIDAIHLKGDEATVRVAFRVLPGRLNPMTLNLKRVGGLWLVDDIDSPRHGRYRNALR